MGKQKRLREAVEKSTPPKPITPLKLGNHTFPVFNGASAAFGARLKDYPPMSSVPEVRKEFRNAFNTLFFRGGSLADFGLSIKPGLDRDQVMTALRSLMSSFDPKHEHKEAVVAWCLSEWCVETPTK
ncbi:hypothetical protein EXN61_11425 [Agrobacterium tumefaciens]|uniref:Uncharacterized protein n=1 Tax=Agrobacterium tumefaciens TaxID=358 RepID=A0A546XYJ8_AGRTU|nr:hypothetical protein [Agrobacterium tumefaciens]TRB05837.1 hypothetical protein EXN61_11425 [Agrobacterium tumefaciens]